MPPVTPEGRSGRRHPAIGTRLRDARHARGLSLRELAERLGVSPSLISQIETGRARPSVSTLYALAGELGVSLDELLFPGEPAMDGVSGTGDGGDEPSGGPSATGPVQPARSRKRIRLASGVTWERLTATSEAGTEFLYVTYEVGGASSPEHEFQRHGGHEWGHVLSGRLRVTIGFDDYDLGPGDSVSIDSGTPHRLANVGAEPVHAIWFVLGRHGREWDIPPAQAARHGAAG